MKRDYKKMSSVRFDSVSREQWERIFGRAAGPQRGTFVMDQGQLVPVESVAVEPSSAPAIHDDRLYRTKYDPGLGVGYSSRTERREKLAAINRAREARGEGRLVEAG